MNESSGMHAVGAELVRTDRPQPTPRQDAAALRRRPDGFGSGRESFDSVEVGGGATVGAYARFSFSRQTGAISIRIVDARTDEVIREIPPERLAQIAEELQALARRAIGGGRASAGAANGAPGTADRGVDHYV